MRWIKWSGCLFAALVAILLLPSQVNSFFDELPSMREKWLSARQWTGMYSSIPEGIVNLEELALSQDSDVVINLIYSEDLHRIDGYVFSETFLRRGHFYPTLLLHGAPSILAPNKLKLEVFDRIQGKRVSFGKLTVERDGPDDLITVSSSALPDRRFRLSPDEYLTEDDLDFRSLLERAREHARAQETP